MYRACALPALRLTTLASSARRIMTTSRSVDTLAVSTSLTDEQKKRLTDVFRTVHHYPADDFPKDILKNVDFFFTDWKGFPYDVAVSELPNLKHLQITSAGVEKLMQHPDFKRLNGKLPFTIGNATGIHVLSIPSYVVNVITSLNHHLPAQLLISKNEKRWASRKDIVGFTGTSEPYFIRTLRGKTVGMLGYGHIGRETARVLQAFGCKIIAANSNGQRREDDGFMLPGTGDKDASLPEQMYSTSDEASFNEFLSKSNILVASLPSTAGTKWLLDAEKLGRLPENSIFVNVGRGTLIKSDEILKALEKPNGLYGVALDVTDPEPLTDGHPLFSHPRVIITPHVSGDTEGERDFTIDLVLANREKIVQGEKVYNAVDLERGY